MSLLFFLGKWSVGGVEQVIVAQANGLVRRGCRVAVFACHYEDRELMRKLDPRVTVVESAPGWLSRANLAIVRDEIRSRQVSIVLNLWCVPYRVTSFLRRAMKGTPARLFAVHHNQPDTNKRIRDARNPLVRMAIRFVSRVNARLTYERSDRFVVLSKTFLVPFARYIWKKEIPKAMAIENPLTLESQAGEKENVILYVGRLEETQKRFSRVLAVWRKLAGRLPDWRLEIVGDGPDRVAYERQSLGLPRMRFVGKVDPRSHYARARLLLLTSDYEGFGLVLTEAMAAGCKPVAFGCQSVIADVVGTDGIVVPAPYDEEMFAEAVLRAAENVPDAAERAEMMRRTRARFGLETYVERWMKAFRPRILHVVPSLDFNMGGPSASVPMTAMAQHRVGADVGIVACRVERESKLSEMAVRQGVERIRYGRFPFRINPLSVSWPLMCGLKSVVERYDVVITHCQWMFPIWWAAHVARQCGKPYYLMPRGSFAPVRLKEKAWKKHLVGWIDRHYARCATAVWATAESEAVEVKAYVPEARVEVFPIGLDVEKYQMASVGGGERRTLLYLSRISPIKGLDMLAEAWGRLVRDVEKRSEGVPRWKLLIVGPDDRGYRAKMEKLFAARCPPESYEFREPAFGEEKTKLLANADAFVLPTRNENWGIAVAEAMASGLPVVCTKGAPWSCLTSCKAGWWCDVSVEGIGGALRELIACSDEERLAMGANGRKWVSDNLDWAVIGERMVASAEAAMEGRR